MKDYLKKHIIDQVAEPNEIEIESVLDIFEEKTYKKGMFFKKPFEKATEIAFMEKGAIRIVNLKDDGESVTLRIRDKSSFFTDFYISECPKESAIGIECLEDVTLLVTPIEKFRKVLETNLMLNIVLRKQLVADMIEIGKNQILFTAGSAKERYDNILENYPDYLEKYPLHVIASLIGVTPTQLSRIRKQK